MSKIDVSVYYFPNFHLGDSHNELWHGKDWCEWELIKHSYPRFDGHYVPKPLWGFEDESKPEVMEKKIDAASKNGIDNFIFDWYYYDDGPFLNKCIEEGFLKAKNKNNIKFSLMWANHDWVDIHPATLIGLDHPIVEAKGDMKKETVYKAFDYIIAHYFNQENYYRLDGGLYFSIYEINRFIDCFGGVEGAKQAILDFRKKIKEAGLGELHLNAVTWGCKILSGESEKPITAEMLKTMGFDSTTSYVWVHEHPLKNFPTNEYSLWAKESSRDFETLTKKFEGIPYYPNVTVGWDPTPRCTPTDKYTNKWYPFMGVIVNNTPEEFKKALLECKEKLLKSDLKTKMFTINAWNEWTEGSYLEPDEKYGLKKLEMIKEVFSE